MTNPLHRSEAVVRCQNLVTDLDVLNTLCAVKGYYAGFGRETWGAVAPRFTVKRIGTPSERRVFLWRNGVIERFFGAKSLILLLVGRISSIVTRLRI